MYQQHRSVGGTGSAQLNGSSSILLQVLPLSKSIVKGHMWPLQSLTEVSRSIQRPNRTAQSSVHKQYSDYRKLLPSRPNHKIVCLLVPMASAHGRALCMLISCWLCITFQRHCEPWIRMNYKNELTRYEPHFVFHLIIYTLVRKPLYVCF